MFLTLTWWENVRRSDFGQREQRPSAWWFRIHPSTVQSESGLTVMPKAHVFYPHVFICSVYVREDPVGDAATVGIPRESIFGPTLSLIAVLSVNQQDGEVDDIEIRQNVWESYRGHKRHRICYTTECLWEKKKITADDIWEGQHLFHFHVNDISCGLHILRQ